jgi:transcriptional regulator with GAF, ATPase, and Fis domain
MATTRIRRTIDEQIAAQEAKLKALRAAKRTAKKTKKEITRESEGVENLLAQLEVVAKANKVKKPVLIRAIAKLTRSGLKIAE